MSKDEYIEQLSAASDERGHLLLEMMDRYGVIGLRELTEEQVEEFYREWEAQNENFSGLRGKPGGDKRAAKTGA